MKFIIYDTTDGSISRWASGSEDAAECQNLGSDQAILTEDEADLRSLTGKKVDLDTLELVEDPDYAPKPARERVDRGKISSETRQAFRDARSNGDIQAQLDALFETLTGEKP